ncbi:phosphopantetheine-binding protein [Pleurocapsa sp. PCC 7319]|uniref:phosphopantetheine-binding protein n=1 Tax=Pleurocapsa sp. PCC 7319 TaxID=118161 RepID=UPI00034C9161|nr:phosphopantetheine-binding protein [Pleurocapsa sp. PCC 7319]
MSKLAQRVEEVIASYFGVELDQVTPENRLIDLSNQPLEQNSLVTALKQEFEIELDEEVQAQAVTVEDVLDLVLYSW